MPIQNNMPVKVGVKPYPCIGKYGTEVAEASWEDVKKHSVVALGNGHWAYGYQIDPIEDN